MMKILFTLNHPAHVHYFKNLIFHMKLSSHEVLVIAREKEVLLQLLEDYKIDYVNRGKGGDGFLGKLRDFFVVNYFIYQKAKKFKPDLFLSCASHNAAQVAFIMRIPSVTLDDTEHNWMNHNMYVPFTNKILTPYCFNKNLGKKHFKFNAFLEFGSLHPDYFKPDDEVYNYLKIDKSQKFILLRFISWGAIHDRGQRGLSYSIKLKAIKELSKHAKVFISSEKELPNEFKKYEIKLPPSLMHHALYYSELLFGESGTMAVEAALLGTPSVRISTLAKSLGNFKELQDKYSLLYFFEDPNQGLDMALSLIKDETSKEKLKERLDTFFQTKIDLNAFMINLLEEYNQ